MLTNKALQEGRTPFEMFFLQHISHSAFLKFVLLLLLLLFFKVSIKHSIEVKKYRFGSDFKSLASQETVLMRRWESETKIWFYQMS